LNFATSRLTAISDLTATACTVWSSLHKALNRRRRACGGDAGRARVSGLLPEDRPRSKLMRGVRDRKLKFGHPGLATTATAAANG
jgi:hypothetical protein